MPSPLSDRRITARLPVPRERQMKRASRRRELDCVGQQRQQRTAHLSAVDPDENGSLRQINLQRQPHLPAQLVRALGQTVQKIGQVGLFQRQRQPPCCT